MMPTTKGMIQTLPNHVLRMGQTIHVDSAQDSQRPTLIQSTGHHGDNDLDISLDNLNHLIMELDPSFEPLQPTKSPSCISPPQVLQLSSSSPHDSYSNKDVPHYKLVPRGCAPCASPTLDQSTSPSIPIPVHSSRSYSPHGTVVFSSSPTSSWLLPPCGSSPRRNPSPRNDTAASQGSLRVLPSNRNSATSLLSTSTCSDTSYILGSNLSLTSEDTDSSPEGPLICTPSFCSDTSRMRPFESRHSPERPSPTKQELFLHGKDPQCIPASLSASLTDVPVVLVNGVPQPDPHHHHFSPTETVSNSRPLSPHSFQAHFQGSQPSMKFVMDTSRFWFRPHISRAEAEALVKDKEPGSFVVRDSTSYRGSFGLAMKVDQVPIDFTPTAYPGETSPEAVRHFLIESSPKGVRIKGSSHEPYFGSLSALVYQHTISAYALPCKLLLLCQDLSTEGKTSGKQSSEDKKNTACNFIYLNAVPTEMLTGPCAVQRAVSSTLENAPAFKPTIVNMKVCLKGVTLTDVNRKLFFRRHYPAQLISHSGEDPDNRVWVKGSNSSCRARMFGFVAKGAEAAMENVCHVFAEYDPLQPCTTAIEFIQASIVKG
ncbi:tensin-4-like [Thalassophryne amazonica]|uniref:tensin-4-like n=1 Tax=Thalassophryne amazonica TaxID=390379 RepID=UPI001471A943|nr:tensin-4-like [Thalassophryne amazonica]